MKHVRLSPAAGFHVVAGTSRSQGATMVLAPGESTGGPDNRHAASDQWLFVLSGRATARVDDQQVELHAGSLLLIEAGETHEIRNEGDDALTTLNVYAPPTD
jgi:mannose-6-phosphate isomerase-like protein (cupin superfamily)